MTHPTPNTFSMGRSGRSHDDRSGRHFNKCRNREGHGKASVLLPEGHEFTRLVNKQLPDLWKIPTPEGHIISGHLRPKEREAAL